MVSGNMFALPYPFLYAHTLLYQSCHCSKTQPLGMVIFPHTSLCAVAVNSILDNHWIFSCPALFTVLLFPLAQELGEFRFPSCLQANSPPAYSLLDAIRRCKPPEAERKGSISHSNGSSQSIRMCAASAPASCRATQSRIDNLARQLRVHYRRNPVTRNPNLLYGW